MFQVKPLSWNIERALVAPKYQKFWDRLVFILPLLEGGGDPHAYGNAGNALAVINGGASWQNTVLGTAVSFDGDGDYLLLNVPSDTLSAAANSGTYMAVYEVNVGAGSMDGFSCLLSNRVGSSKQLILQDDGGRRNTFAWDGTNNEFRAVTNISAPTVGVPYLVVCSIEPNAVRIVRTNLITQEFEEYTDTNANTAGDTLAGDWYVGVDSFNVNTRAIDAQVMLAGVWARAWNAEEIREFATDVFGMIRPDLRIIAKAPVVGAEEFLGRQYPQGVMRGVMRGAA